MQLKSADFRSATALLAVASFWANFYIGAVDLQLADQDFMSAHDQVSTLAPPPRRIPVASP
jgi:hypothetical protein